MSERCFSTGDLGRSLPDGTVEYAGRRDLQVKIRGHRVEVAEIESGLKAYPGIVDAAVVPKHNASGRMMLAAYLVCRKDAVVELKLLRRYLERLLPSALVPSVLAAVPSLPHTTTGKVDRWKLQQENLPGPERTALARQDDVRDPRRSLERLILDVWRRVFGMEHLRGRDDFFELGGDSVMALGIAAEIHRVTGLPISPRDVLECPTVAEVTARALSSDAKGARPDMDAPSAGWQPGTAPLSPAQRRYWARIRQKDCAESFNVGVAIHIHGKLDLRILKRAARTLLQRHDALRTIFRLTPAGPRQFVRPISTLRLPVVDFARKHPGRAKARLRALESAEISKILNLARGPLVRMTVAKVSTRHHVLLLVQHHLVTDGWSRRLFERELLLLYSAFVRGLPSPLGPKGPSFVGFAARESKVFDRRLIFGSELEYWREHLREMPVPAVRLPGRAGAVQLRSGVRSVSVRLDAVIRGRLRSLCIGERTTPFVVHLTALKIALALVTGSRDITVTTDWAGRSTPDTHDLYGLLSDVLILRTAIDPACSFRVLVQRVRDTVVGAQAHQGVPFAQIADALWPQRLGAYDELFPVAFFFENDEPGPRGSGLFLRTRELPSAAPSRDLIVTCWASDSALVTTAAFRSAHVAEAWVRRVMKSFVEVIAVGVSEPERGLSGMTERHLPPDPGRDFAGGK